MEPFMLCHHEQRSTHNLVPPGAIQVGHVGTWEKSPLATCATRADYPNGCGWNPEPSNCPGTECIEADCAALAAALSGFSTGGAGKGWTPSWSYCQKFATKNN